MVIEFLKFNFLAKGMTTFITCNIIYALKVGASLDNVVIGAGHGRSTVPAWLLVNYDIVNGYIL